MIEKTVRQRKQGCYQRFDLGITLQNLNYVVAIFYAFQALKCDNQAWLPTNLTLVGKYLLVLSFLALQLQFISIPMDYIAKTQNHGGHFVLCILSPQTSRDFSLVTAIFVFSKDKII